MNTSIDTDLDTKNLLEDSSKFTMHQLRVNQLTIDPKVQRDFLDEAKVRRIFSGFDVNALGVITVSDRDHGEYVALDGMHRVEAVRRLTDNAGSVPCKVFTGLTRPEEARIFLLLNSGNQPNLYEKYKVNLTAENSEVMDIDKVVHYYGLVVSRNPKANNNINAIFTLQKLYRLEVWDEAQSESVTGVLSLTLKAITQAWGGEYESLLAPMLEGVGRYIAKNYASYEHDRLVTGLRSHNPGKLLADARAYASLRHMRIYQAVGQMVGDAYNQNLPTNSKRRLPNFMDR